MSANPDVIELSRAVPLARLERGPVRLDIAADADERARLAARLGLESIDRLEAEVELRTSGRGLYRVEGRLRADVVQVCVVSLEPVPARIDEPFHAYFTSDPSMTAEVGGEIEVAIEEADSPEPVESDSIDAGEVVAQFLAVSLDPYPRAPGAEPDLPEGVEKVGPRANPFAALEALRGKG